MEQSGSQCQGSFAPTYVRLNRHERVGWAHIGLGDLCVVLSSLWSAGDVVGVSSSVMIAPLWALSSLPAAVWLCRRGQRR